MDISMFSLRNLILWWSLIFSCLSHANSQEGETKQTLDKLFDRCRSEVIDPSSVVDVDKVCQAELDEYFSDQSIWEYLELKYYVPGHYQHPPLRPMFTSQTSDLRMKETNNPILGEIPKWRTIFDQKIEIRDHLVSQVFQDEICKNLLSGPIRPELNDRCSGGELFKYATYLDMCLTGLHRYDWLIQKEALSEGQSFFVYGLEALETFPEEEQELRSNRFMNGILNAVWLVQKCAHMPVSAFDSNLKTHARVDQIGIQQLIKLLGTGQDAALNIAARSGDKWALYSYHPPSVSSEVDYWKSLLDIEPYLVHYWLANGRSTLSEEHEIRHAVRAYAMKYGAFHESTFDTYMGEFLFRLSWVDAPITNPIVQRIINNEEGESDSNCNHLVGGLEYPW